VKGWIPAEAGIQLKMSALYTVERREKRRKQLIIAPDFSRRRNYTG
jgi:hypothetical protein